MNKFIVSALCVLFAFAVKAQPGCPAVNAGNSAALPCGTPCTQLHASYFQTGSTATYSVSQIPYTPFSYTGGTSVIQNVDDTWSQALPIPFNFCFFDTVYNSLMIGSNSMVSFNTYNATSISNPFTVNYWSISGPIPNANSAIDTTNQTNNSIMAPWEDIDPTNTGSISYQVIGTAPCRIFVISWNQCPYYGDPNSVCASCDTDVALYATSQVALYETTNVIEIYIAQKDVLEAWNNGWAVEGIENNSATVAYTVPGRNATNWTATNDAWRFTPSGPSIVSFGWYNGNNLLSTDTVLSVCPSVPTTYTAKAVYTPCAGGTPVTETDNVTITPAGNLVAQIDSVKSIGCSNGTGSAYASVSGGNAPVTYGWSNGATTLSITNLSAGTYVFTATDASGCLRIDTVHITQNASISVNIPNATVVNCTGTGTDSLVPQITGGNAPYIYNWSNGQHTATATNLTSGTYTLTVIDASGCSASGSGTVSITGPNPALALGAPTIQNISCYGNTDGSIVSNATGGTVPYTYAWSNSSNTPALNNLGVSTYGLTVTDNIGCTVTATYNITQPTQLIINAPTIQNIGCGVYAGSIYDSAQGGTPAYTYSWVQQSNSQTYSGTTLTNLTADTYNLTVTDANGCTQTASYTVTQSPQLLFTTDTTLVSCYGGNDGTATVTVTNGTPPYSFSWDGGPPTNTTTLTNLSLGPVDVVVSDATGCSIDHLFQINQPAQLTVQLVSLTNALCADSSSGTITVAGAGGTPNYTYNWNTGQTTPAITNLLAGNYGIAITDANGCTAAQTYTVGQPTPISINQPNIQNIGCQGGNSGSITANVTQGSPPYNYSWLEVPGNQVLNGQTISNLPVATYYLLVTDANGCKDTSSYSISAITPLSISTSFIPVSCYNGNNGTAQVSINTGTPPYRFLWNNTTVVSDSILNNLNAGPVMVIVTDANNCLAQSTINITQPTQIVITQTGGVSAELCHGGANGEVVISAAGGTPPYNYAWTNGFGGTDNTGLTAGNYTAIVVDNNLCADTATYTITEPTALVANPTFINAKCYGGADGIIDINPSGGTPVYSFVWNNGETVQAPGDLARGSYSCTITDHNGCTLVATDTVGQPAQMVSTYTSTKVKCNGQHNGTATVTTTGDNPPYIYNATRDYVNFITSTNGIITGLDTGTYDVEISDSLGCSAITYIYVPAAIPDSFNTATDSALCYGYSDGGAFIVGLTTINGPYQFGIDNGALQDTGYFSGLAPGLHTITAVNANGCLDTIPVFVEQPLPIEAIVTPDSVTLPLGGSQQVEVTYLNATNPTFNWVNTLGFSCTDCPNPVVSSYLPGDYQVIVSMINGNATCYGSTILHVNVLNHTKAFVPNAFTPNGDGNNDLFLIYGEDIKTVSMKVFNRWGELVFETKNSMQGWDGTYKGVLQMPAVFTYEATVTYLDDSQESKKGTVTLIR